MPNQLSTDHEWIIHSLNIHGLFFQRKCVELINTLPVKSQHIKVIDTEYPVEYPQQRIMDMKNKESRLDIFARISDQFYVDRAINLVIECKKNNPDYTNWVFFEKYPDYDPKQDFIATFDNGNEGACYTAQSTQIGGYVSSDGREVKENYSNLNVRDKTKTTNANIEDACYQVVVATHSLLDEQYIRFTLPREKRINSQLSLYLFIPIIVTTANLYICEYSVSDVSIDRGEISLEKPKLKEVKSLLFEYPIPPHLQLHNGKWRANTQNAGRDISYRRDIYIVNSQEFQDMLIRLICTSQNLLDFD